MPTSTKYAALEVSEDAADGPPAHAGVLLIVSHACTITFAKAWELALPLALLTAWGGRSLMAPAAVTLATTLTSMLLAPSVGRRADQMERGRAMRLARAVQLVGTGGSVAGAYALGTATSRSWLAVVLVGASAECLGTLVTKSAPKKDWAPTVFEGEVETLSRVTVRLSTVAQIAEIVGPFMGAVALDCFPTRGAALVGGAAIAAEIPAQLALEALYARAASLRAPRAEAEVSCDDVSLRSAWGLWLSQPSGTALLTVSFSLLFFTVLAPHAAVLMAYLSSRDVPALTISLFRAFGAVAGVAGVTLFAHISGAPTRILPDLPGSDAAGRILAVRRAAAVALVGQAFAVVVAALAIDARRGILVFMGAIVVSRAGLYGYDVAYLELQQLLVDERARTSCSGVEAALCGGAELTVAIAVLAACPDPDQFDVLARGSAVCVIVSLIVFGLWAKVFHVHAHHHHAETTSTHKHTHTLQQTRGLTEGAGAHVHVHYAGPRLRVEYDDHDDHSHSHSHSPHA